MIIFYDYLTVNDVICMICMRYIRNYIGTMLHLSFVYTYVIINS